MSTSRKFSGAMLWQAPPEPVDVQRVIDNEDDAWDKLPDGEWFCARHSARSGWEKLLREYGPVTEVVVPRPVVSFAAALAVFMEHPGGAPASLRAALKAVGCEVVE